MRLLLLGCVVVLGVGCALVEPPATRPVAGMEAERARVLEEMLAKNRRLQVERAAAQRAQREERAQRSRMEQEEREAKASAQEAAVKVATEELKAAKVWLDSVPSTFVTLPPRRLVGDITALIGQRVRVSGKVTTQRDQLRIETMGEAKKALGKIVAIVSISKDRGAVCLFEGAQAWVAAGRLWDGDTVALTGTVAIAEKAAVALKDCDAPVVLKKQPLARYEATRLTRDYASNQMAATSEYDNYILEVAGTVHAVSEGYAILRGHSPRHFVYCALADGISSETIATLAKGRRAVFVGVPSGYHQSGWRQGFEKGVMVSGCQVAGRK